MASTILPREVTEHLEAAIQLANRQVHLRFLDEAELLLSFHLRAAAVLVAGVVLETELPGSGSQDLQRIEKWSELRNRAAHKLEGVVTADEAKEMVDGVRAMLTRREVPFGPRRASPGQVRGKYSFVPTSAGEFIRRKADELRLEHDGPSS